MSDTVDESNTISKPFPTSLLVPIIIVIVLSVLSTPIFCCFFCCCRARRRESNTAADKRQYLRAKASEPGLTYEMWKKQNTQATTEAERARNNLIQHPNDDLDFPMFPGQDTRRMKAKRPGARSLLGMLFVAFFALRKEAKSRALAAPGDVAARDRIGDEEIHVGGEAEAAVKMKMEMPAKTTAWGSDVPPAYSKVCLEEL